MVVVRVFTDFCYERAEVGKEGLGTVEKLLFPHARNSFGEVILCGSSDQVELIGVFVFLWLLAGGCVFFVFWGWVLAGVIDG